MKKRIFIPGFDPSRTRAASLDVEVPDEGTWDVYELVDGVVRLVGSRDDRDEALRLHPRHHPAALARSGVVLSGNDHVDLPTLLRFQREVKQLTAARPPALMTASRAGRVGASPSSGPSRAPDANAPTRSRRTAP